MMRVPRQIQASASHSCACSRYLNHNFLFPRCRPLVSQDLASVDHKSCNPSIINLGIRRSYIVRLGCCACVAHACSMRLRAACCGGACGTLNRIVLDELFLAVVRSLTCVTCRCSLVRHRIGALWKRQTFARSLPTCTDQVQVK